MALYRFLVSCSDILPWRLKCNIYTGLIHILYCILPLLLLLAASQRWCTCICSLPGIWLQMQFNRLDHSADSKISQLIRPDKSPPSITYCTSALFCHTNSHSLLHIILIQPCSCTVHFSLIGLWNWLVLIASQFHVQDLSHQQCFR